MTSEDLRWKQRFSNFKKALNQLSRIVEKESLNEIEEQGLIQSFEYNYELAWNVLKDFYEYHGENSIHGSKDAIRLAFRRGLIQNGETWMNMVKNRALTSHTYNENTAREVVERILNEFFPEFCQFRKTMESLEEEQD